jgi:hypothetical protein
MSWAFVSWGERLRIMIATQITVIVVRDKSHKSKTVNKYLA